MGQVNRPEADGVALEHVLLIRMERRVARGVQMSNMHALKITLCEIGQRKIGNAINSTATSENRIVYCITRLPFASRLFRGVVFIDRCP